MTEKLSDALSLAYKRVMGKNRKIAELKITPDMTENEADGLITELATAKADATGTDWKKELAGQRWYVEDLFAFCSMTAKERLDHEYEKSFPDVADEDEMLKAIEASMAVKPAPEDAAAA